MENITSSLYDNNSIQYEQKIIICGHYNSICIDRINNIFSIKSDQFIYPLASEFSLSLSCNNQLNYTKILYRIFTPKKIKPFWFPTISCFVLTYNINDEKSLLFIEEYWLTIIKDNNLSIPVFIIAYNIKNSDNGDNNIKFINAGKTLSNKYNCKFYYINDISTYYYVESSILCANSIYNLYNINNNDNNKEQYNKITSSIFNWHELLDNNLLYIRIISRFILSCDNDILVKYLDLSNIGLIGNKPFPKWFYKVLGYSNIIQLNLSNNQISDISKNIKYISNLEILNISYNNLEYLPTSLTLLESLRKIKIKGNTLSYIPKISLKTTKTLLLYLQSLNEKSIQWNTVKLILVGSENVGKTTLLAELLQQKIPMRSFQNITSLRKKQKDNTSISNISTDGIDIRYWEKNDIIFNCWDFAGQTIFYPTHQFFLSGRSIYILTFNLISPETSKIEYWLSQINAVSTYISYVIIVGTHADNPICTEEYITTTINNMKKIYQRRFPFIQEYFTTSINDRSSFSKVSNFITCNIVKKHRLLKTKVSGSWNALNNAIILKRSFNIQILSLDDFNKLAYHYGIYNDQLDIIKEFLHDIGSIINLPTSSFIVIDPSWLSKVMTSIITLKHKWITNGILLQSNWIHIWSSFPSKLHSQLFSLLESFEVVHQLSGNPSRALVPSLLPDTIPKDLNDFWNNNINNTKIYRYGRIWKFSFLPIGIFARILVRFINFKEGKIIHLWKYGILMLYHKQLALLTNNEDDNTFSLQVTSVKPGLPLIMQKALESVNSTIEIMYNFRVDQKQIFIPCIHCWKSDGIEHPYLFPIENIILALSRSSPFVYCNDLITRKVRIDHLAPDITFSNIPVLDKTHFIIEKKIGEGGSAIVYKGKMNFQNNEQIAIKEIITNDNEELVEVYSLFKHEVQIMSNLEHPNLVQLLGITNIGNPMYIIMEYIPGGTLYELLHNSKYSNDDLDWGLRTRIALDIAKGMNYLHSITPPFIHRDLRSPNILIQSINKNDSILAKVSDFGLTCANTSKISGILATWQWHAPEVLSSKSKFYDEKIDIYSFGIILWEIVSRKYPFEEYSNDERFCRIMEDENNNKIYIFQEIQMREAIEYQNIRPTIPNIIPNKLKILIEQCWNHEANKRPSFENIVTYLSEILQIQNNCDPQLINIHTYYNPNRIRQSHIYSEIKFLNNGYKISKQLFSYSYSVSLPQTANPLCLLVACGNVWCGCDTGDILIWNTKDQKLIKSYKPHNTCIYSLLIVGDEIWSTSECYTIFTWNIDNYSKQETMITNEQSVRRLFLDYFSHNNDKQYVWSCSPKGAIQLWDTKSYSCIKSIELNKNRINYIQQISRKEVWIAADNIIIIVSKDLEILHEFKAHKKKINCIIAQNNTIWTCSDDNTIAIWNHDKTLKQSIEVHTKQVNCLLALGNYVCSGSSDKSIIIWDAQDEKPLQELEGYHDDQIKCIIATGATLWSASFDKTVAVWTLV